MTPAELKTIRENLGLTVQWLAENAKVSHRSATYWEAGKGKVPDDVAALLESVAAKIQTAADEAIKQVNNIAIAQGLPDEIVLLRYKTDADLHKYRPDFIGLPVTCHAALLGIISRELRLMGIKASIAYFDEAAYLAWLSGRADNEGERAAWGAEI